MLPIRCIANILIRTRIIYLPEEELLDVVDLLLNFYSGHVEELVRLPKCFLCYMPSPEAGPVTPTPALSNGFITFGSFNNLAKITPKVLQVWARILCAVPNSRLVVKCKPFCCDSVRQRFLSTLEQLVSSHLLRSAIFLLWERVSIAFPSEKCGITFLAEERQPFRRFLQLSLDTFPYAGTTTTCESLYMGVPCVTMGSLVHAHNVGVSLLNTVGKWVIDPCTSKGWEISLVGHGTWRPIGSSDDIGKEPWGTCLRFEGNERDVAETYGLAWLGHLVAKNEDEYVRLALALASDVTALSNLRLDLRNLMSKSPLCDGSKFTLGLESAYRDVWRRYCKGDVPSLKRMETLQQQQPHHEEVAVKSSNVTKTTTSRESPLGGSIKANRYALNLSASEENGVQSNQTTNSAKSS
ncbi:tetratricopeptide repeat (TPR)-like superfamily protein [Actinidia rufa]|uniref:Tetratricopeptide repeat (TPR)-like superfamily protein n=1 Tax=Actinidia rufa TaxID=165716 RepID=A0A7J0GDQ2_9ERIC|nr:tetratricopeptide repeat (TPR)-like superfamily protein [Actinidia rufa]